MRSGSFPPDGLAFVDLPDRVAVARRHGRGHDPLDLCHHFGVLPGDVPGFGVSFAFHFHKFSGL